MPTAELIPDVHPFMDSPTSAKISSGNLRPQLILTRIRGVSIAGGFQDPVLDQLLKDWSDLGDRLTYGDRDLISIEALTPPLSQCPDYGDYNRCSSSEQSWDSGPVGGFSLVLRHDPLAAPHCI
jgi:hypothetical protein